MPRLPLLLPPLAAGLLVSASLAGARQAGSSAIPDPERSVERTLEPTPGLVRAGHATFRVGDPPRLPAALSGSPEDAEGVEPGYFIVHFGAPVTPADRAWLDELTGPVQRPDGSSLARAYLPDDALLAWVDGPRTWRALVGAERTDWVGRYQPGYKLDPGLIEAALAETPDDEPRLWSVDPIPGHGPERLARDLERLGARVLQRVHRRGAGPYDLDLLVVEAPAAAWARLARVEGIGLVREREASSAGRLLAGDLDAQRAVALGARAQSGSLVSERLGLRPPGAGYDEAAALVDLLAFDDPLLRAWTPAGRPDASAFEPPLKNALAPPAATLAAVERELGQDGELAQGRASAALVRAQLIQAALGSDGRSALERERLVHDVPRRAGFGAPGEAPHVYRFACDGVAPLDVTLCWTDEPGAPGSIGRCLNDLDLIVRAPGGAGYRGNRFDENGASRPGGLADRVLTAEHVALPEPEAGLWTVTVQPARGPFAAPQGYALLVRGSGLVEEGAGTQTKRGGPLTATLQVVAAQQSAVGALSFTDVQRLRWSDDSRYRLPKRQQLALAFENGVPDEALVSAVRVRVEHHELRRVNPGDVTWSLGQGSILAPVLVDSTTAPVHEGVGAETLDTWLLGALPGPSDLVLVIDNPNLNDGTVLDRVEVEVDYTLPDLRPRILSSPSPSAILGQAYVYDADERLEAEGPGPITWSVVGGPAGFSVHPTTGLVRWTPESAGTFAVAIRATNGHGSQEQDFSVAVETAPLPPTLLPASPVNQTYLPPERLAFAGPKSQQRLNVFLPPGKAPRDGWPVVLNNRAGGGIAAPPLTELNDTGGTAPLHSFVGSGVAVVDFGVTGIGNGQGLFYPPGHATGRYESFQPGNDNPEKEAESAVQWVKTQDLFPLDTQRICLRGSSQGAIIAMWAAMGPQRARPVGSDQVRASTRVKAVLGLQPPTSVWALDQSTAINTRMTQHYERANQPGVPATAFGQVTEELQKTSSVMGFGFESPGARAHNETQPVCLLFAEPVTMTGGLPADLTLDAQGYPNLHDTLGQPYIHDSWSGYVLWRRLVGLSKRAADFHAAHSTFAVRNTTALAPPFNDHTQTFSGDVFGAQARALAHQWVLRELRAGNPTSPKIAPVR